MSTGSAPVRGALFVLVVVLLDASVVSPETPVSTSDSAFRLRWLSDLGANSTVTHRATSRSESDSVLARVPGASYLLTIENGFVRKRRRIAADFSMVYGLARGNNGELVIAADDGSINFWSGSGIADDDRLSLRWRRDLGERGASVGWDGGGSVWFGTRQNQLIAFSAMDGETEWSVSVEGRVEAPPVRVGDALFVATKGGTLLCLDASTGKARWSADLPGPANHPPVVTGDGPRGIVVATRNGHLLAVGAETGETHWSTELGARLSGAPIATERFAAVPTEDGVVRAYDLSGEPLWRQEGVAGERTDLVYHESSGGTPLVIAVSTNLTLLDASTGAILNDYPAAAEEDIEERFLDAMLEGERRYSESEKASIFARESFPIRGRLFGHASLHDDDLAFGTEEGWIYWFDTESVRPVGRYRAGPRAADVPVWASETLAAAASESVFGLDPASGDTLWRRDVGTVKQIVAGETLAIVGADRIDVLDPQTGARRWSAQGEYRAVSPVEGGSWMAFSRTGKIQALDAVGTAIGSPMDPVGPIEAVTTLSEHTWAVASRDGLISAIAWEEWLLPIWEVRLEAPVEALYASGATLVVADEERLVGLSRIDGSSKWELSLAEGATCIVNDHVFVYGEGVLRLYEPDGGTLLKELPVESKTVAAALDDDTILWLDVSGTAHQAPLQGNGVAESVDLGEPVTRASFENGMFLVTTHAGEVGLVEVVTAGGTALSQPQ